ncbi:MAG: hypothetical protein E6Y99_02300 [Finegoldia magna]|uniref:hypothetical protein n=1 Tax=Finegoldia magna TaxID=1260 RepID=UPI002907F58E|nr:hypothetical protein [Finegoldia magna]MDU5960395.1 hypothetical protein [Finegoldia magna]
MRYDGKINNGIELKESEGNLFQRIIMEILKILKGKNEVWYSLSYDEEKHRYFDKNFLLSYLSDNYLNNKEDIEPTKLSNDLITFKTYRDDVDINVRKQNDFYQFLTIAIAIISILASNFIGDNTDKIIKELFSKELFIKYLFIKYQFIKAIFIVIIIFVLVGFVHYLTTTCSHSESYKLKVINNVIYTLETIKEDMDKTENLRAKYKATRNRYSPRAMYERKRR